MSERQNSQEFIDIRLREEVEFPRNPQERFNALFAAIGNSEAKCLTLLCLSESPITSQDLHRKFINESKKVWRTNEVLQRNYCQESLVPIGLVAEADILSHSSIDYVLGYRLTKAGLEYGQPIAAYLLSKSVDLDISLNKTFGATAAGSGKTRSVINRVKLLEYLASQDKPIRIQDILETSDFKNRVTVAQNLQHLASLGLCNYQFLNLEQKGGIIYVQDSKTDLSNIKTVESFTSLTKLVAEIIDRFGQTNNVDIARRLEEETGNRYGLNTITSVLSGLTLQGFCKRATFKGREIYSQATITEKGKKVFDEVILPIKQALTRDVDLLSKWRQIPYQQIAAKAVQKYRVSSGKANRKAHDEWISSLEQYIIKHPGVRPKEIKKVLGIDLSRILSELISSNKIYKERKGMSVRYFPSKE